MELRSKKITVTEAEAKALNELQAKTEVNARGLQHLFATFLRCGEVEADLERCARELGGVGSLASLRLADKHAQALLDLRAFQAMLAEEISTGCTHALRIRERTREILAEKGILAAKDSGEFDEVEIVVGIDNPSFSVPDGGLQS